jgi:hypothetical protein
VKEYISGRKVTMTGYDYGRGDEGTRWNQGKKGIIKEVWQRKNWSCGKGKEEE